MARNAFDRELGLTQGRIVPVGWVPPEGDYAFVFGRDGPGLSRRLASDDVVAVSQTARFGREFTADSGTDVITLAGHGYENNHAMTVKNDGGALPAGLSANTVYYVINATTDTFKLAANPGGAAIDITNAGTGTHLVSQNTVRFRARIVPPSRVPIETDNTQTFTIMDGWTLLVSVDGGAPQTITFNTADFADIANALAYEIAAVINAQLTSAVASSAIGKVSILSDKEGKGSSVEITGGTAETALNFGNRVWKAGISIDDVVQELFVLTPGFEREISDVTANVSKESGSVNLGFGMQLFSV